MKVVNAITGEGANNSHALTLSHRKPESVHYHTLENLYTWTIGARAIDIVPVSILGSDVTVHPGSEALFSAMKEHLVNTWISGRLYGSAWLDEEHEIHIGEPTDVGEHVCLAHFTGKRNVGRQKRRKHISTLLSGYDDILRYGMALSIGSHLLQKSNFISYPVPNLYQNAADPHYLCTLSGIVRDMQSLGLMPYDASGSNPKFNELDLERVSKYTESLAQAVSSALAIPHSLLFSQAPKGTTSGRFEIAQWIIVLRFEVNKLLAAWKTITTHYGHSDYMSVNLESLIDLYIADSVNRTVE